MVNLTAGQTAEFTNDHSLAYGRIVRLMSRDTDGVWLVQLVDFPGDPVEQRIDKMFANERFLQVVENDIQVAESYLFVTVVEWSGGFEAIQHRLAHVKTEETPGEVIANIGKYWFGVGKLVGEWAEEEDVYLFKEYPDMVVKCENYQLITLAEYVRLSLRGIPDVTHRE